MAIQCAKHPSSREVEVSEVSDKPLVAILVSPDGPEEVWVLGRKALGGQPSPEDVTLGKQWVERLGWLQRTPGQTTFS